MRIRSIFRYPGSKNRLGISNAIRSFFPNEIKNYREPFVGSGGLFFSLDNYESRWINDLDEGLISVYLALRDNSDEFISECRSIPCIMESENKESCEEYLKEKFNEIVKRPSDDPLRYFFLNRVCWGGRVREDYVYFSNPQGWNITRDNGHLEKIAEYLQDAEITNYSYEKLISTSGEDVFLYCDPPYVSDTNRDSSNKFYDNSFEIEDHNDLFINLSSCSFKWCLSYDNDPLILDLYKDFNIFDLSWTYNIQTKKRPTGEELIITNYIPERDRC